MHIDNAHVLLVEDNEGDIFFTLETLEEAQIKSEVSVVRNGQEALDFLFRKGNFLDAKKPDLILLDINMPIFNGHEVLAMIGEDENLKNIPVVMLTTSSNPSDIEKALANNAKYYMVKPIDTEIFLSVIKKNTNIEVTV